MALPTRLLVKARPWFAAALLMGWNVSAVQAQARDAGADSEPGFSVMPFWTEDQSPADFLDIVGKNTKARWRQLYRQQPPTPPPDRAKAAFILGGLVGDSFLVLAAGDTQQFRNNNQEVLTYSKVLGLGELIAPRLMAQAKMAETGHWPELRQEIISGHAEMTRLLDEQMDKDLAVLVDLGVWMRVLEAVSAIVAEAPNGDIRPLCIGSPALLEDMRTNFATLGGDMRADPLIKQIDQVLREVESLWSRVDEERPTQSTVVKTHAKLKGLMESLTLK